MVPTPPPPTFHVKLGKFIARVSDLSCRLVNDDQRDWLIAKLDDRLDELEVLVHARDTALDEGESITEIPSSSSQQRLESPPVVKEEQLEEISFTPVSSDTTSECAIQYTFDVNDLLNSTTACSPQHMVSSSQPSFTCELCGKSLNSKQTLHRHRVQVHGAGRPYVCSVCSARFKRVSHLQVHEASVHAKHRPYKCEEHGCDRSFARLDGLVNHSVVHKDHSQRPYKCNHCRMGFATNSYRNRHERSCTRPRVYDFVSGLDLMEQQQRLQEPDDPLASTQIEGGMNGGEEFSTPYSTMEFLNESQASKSEES